MLSANLAVLNFLPIPALDGGHMLFLSAEAVRGKPVDETTADPPDDRRRHLPARR